MASWFKMMACFTVGVFLWHTFVIAGETTGKSPYRELRWEELVPASWHPEKIFDALKLDDLADDDPRALEALEAFAAEWKKAPANTELQGKRIKIPGYVAPLDWENVSELKEFLLVPYFGACIHVPPPPANQIIHISMDTPLKEIGSMAAVWVYGELLLEINDYGDMGASSYRMKPDKVEIYE
ncbi:MAG: DUF3299 domain-containing protein [Candidatus Accumulibacter sp.]|jgi:hypothetical protein|nr:DUF3299 domain-containing protein [Accumulibacter sp.]